MINIIYKQYNSTLFISLILIFLLILFSLKYSFYLYLFFIIISNILFYLFDKKNIFYFFFLSIIVINILYLSFYNNIIENYRGTGTNNNNPTETIQPYCNSLISELENEYDRIIQIVREGSEEELRKYYKLFHHHDSGSKITSESLGIITPQIKQLLEAYARKAKHKRQETVPIINIEQSKLNIINQLEKLKKVDVERFKKYCIKYNKKNLKILKKDLLRNIKHVVRIHS